MKGKKLLAIAVVGLVLFLIIGSPERAAGIVRDGFGLLGDAAQNIVEFAAGIF